MKQILSPLLLAVLAGAAACAQSEPVHADEVEAVVKDANEQVAPELADNGA